MLYLFWALLNLALFLIFVSICFRAAKLIQANLGFLASVVFIFGLLSLASDSNNETNANSSTVKKWNFANKQAVETLTSKYAHITLDQTWTTTTSLAIQFGREKITKKLLPTEAYSSLTGFVGGYVWEPEALLVGIKAEQLTYLIDGTLEWKVLGMTVYNQHKRYSGSITVQ
ncbi:hypothetical protein [Spirosoma sp. KNUC1025]|uniref:hypothetical protein n=1 Tax=Spirosoma sp. KNUC1025 TaxID=2894082 RepID=UPI003864FB89|nr:hypothetical protein LN737_07815 [Spirosoma sp. KNUC1025]